MTGKTTHDLRQTLFDAIEQVKTNKMTAGDANAIAGIAKVIVDSGRVDLMAQQVAREAPADTKAEPMQLTGPEAPELIEDEQETETETEADQPAVVTSVSITEEVKAVISEAPGTDSQPADLTEIQAVEVIEHWQEGAPPSEIAAAMNVDIVAVQKAISDHRRENRMTIIR